MSEEVVLYESRDGVPAMAWARILADSAPLEVDLLCRDAKEMVPRSKPQLQTIARRDSAAVAASADRADGQSAFGERRKPIFPGQ